MRQRYLRRRSYNTEPGPPPEQPPATPEQIEALRQQHEQLKAQQAEWYRKLKAGELPPSNVLKPCRDND